MLLPVLCTAMLLPPLSMGANLIPSAFAHLGFLKATCCCCLLLIVTYRFIVIVVRWQLLLPPLPHNSVAIALTIAISKDAALRSCCRMLSICACGDAVANAAHCHTVAATFTGHTLRWYLFVHLPSPNLASSAAFLLRPRFNCRLSLFVIAIVVIDDGHVALNALCLYRKDGKACNAR